MMKCVKILKSIMVVAQVFVYGFCVADEKSWSSNVTSAEDRLPQSTVPAFEGYRYEAMVSDTLDLAERMKLSINGITRCVDGPPPNPFPCTQVHSNHFINIDANGPKVLRNVNLYGKYMLGVLLARIVTGEERNLQVDNDWRNAWIDWQKVNPVMNGPEGGRRLEWISFNIRRESEPNKSAWTALANRAVDRLYEASVPYKDSRWLMFSSNIPDEGFPSIQEALLAQDRIEKFKKGQLKIKRPQGWDASTMTWCVQGLTAVYNATENRKALMLAGKIARYLKDYANLVAPDGRLLAGHPHEWPVIHWHHSVQTALACGEYGLASEDSEFLEFADTVYRHVMTFCSPETGFAPEYAYGKFPRVQEIDNTEACCSADLILMALWPTLGNVADYWDDIDRYIRNHIATLQLTDTRWFYELPENRGKWIYPDPAVEAKISPLTGQFGGWATVNEWYDPKLGPGIMTCCIGNSTRTFYYVWENMIDCSDETLKIHLMLNRASACADMNNYQPYEGKFEIKLKKNCKQILVRAPEWIPTGSPEISLSVDDSVRQLQWQDRYLDLGSGSAGQQFMVQFPIEIREVKRNIGRVPCTLTIKGNTVIHIDPPGQRFGLYQRDQYRNETAPRLRVSRFIPTNLF